MTKLNTIFSLFIILNLLFYFKGYTQNSLHELGQYFPQIEEWQRAGFQKEQVNFTKLDTLVASPSTPLQVLLDSLEKKNGGILWLEIGTYPLDTVLMIPDNVFLVGESPNKVVIESSFKYHFEPLPLKTPCNLTFENVKNGGIKNLTFIYKAVDFEPKHNQYFYEGWDKAIFKNDPNADTTLYVGHLGIKSSFNILVENCRFLNAGTDPIIVANSHFVTIQNSEVKGSYNKGGKGNGYFNIDANSTHVLVTKNKVSKIRHLSIQNGAAYNVIFDNYFEVDVNFHNGDGGNNLVENNIVRIPEWHGWHCFSAGAKSKHRPPGEGNILLNNFTQYKLPIASIRENVTEYGNPIIYESYQVIDTLYIKDNPMVLYQYGALDTLQMQSSDQIYEMNPVWDKRKRVLKKELPAKITKIYQLR